MTRFDDTNSYFTVDAKVPELREGVIQIQHLRPTNDGKDSIHQTAPFDIKTGELPELLETLMNYYRSITLDRIKPKECEDKAEDESIPQLEKSVERLYDLVRPVYSMEVHAHDGDYEHTLAQEVYYLLRRVERLEKTSEQCTDQESLSDNNSKDKVLDGEEFVDRLFKCFDSLHDPEGARQCVNNYEIWGSIIGTDLKFDCIIEAASRKHALQEAEDNTVQLVNDTPHQMEFGARLHIPTSN